LRNTNKNKITEIHIIRHGKTEANEQKLYCGATDLPLSSNGIAELVDLKRQCIYPKHADLFFTSGLVRAEQTLDLLYGSVHRIALPKLAEFNFGSFEMQSHETLKGRSDYQAWIADESGALPCPGGESRQGFARRVTEGYELLTEHMQHGKDLFVVCHGGTIACIMEHLFPNTHNFYEWQPKPGRGYTLVYISGRLQQYKPNTPNMRFPKR